MQNFQSFITEAAGSLGVSGEDAGQAAKGLLGLIQKKASSEDASSLISALPGAQQMLGSAEAQSGGGMLGGLMGAAGGLLGGKAGGALSVLSIFQGANMDSGQAGSFAGMFVDFLTKNAGDDLVNRVLGQIPELKKLLG